MNEHLTDQNIRALLRGGLTGTDLLEANGHLAQCADCRGRAQASLPQNALTSVRDAFLAKGLSEEAHPEFETLSAYLDGALGPDPRADVRRHLDGCGQCRGEIQAMGTVRREVRDSPAKVYAPANSPGVSTGWADRLRTPLWRPGLLTGAATLVAAALFFGLHTQPTRGPIVASYPAPQAPEEHIETFEPNEAAASGPNHLPYPLLKSPADGQLASHKPTLLWQSAAGANGYRVFLYRTDGDQLVAISPRLTQTHWTPVMPLQPGAFYQWTVQAYLEGKKFGRLSAAAHFHTE